MPSPARTAQEARSDRPDGSSGGGLPHYPFNLQLTVAISPPSGRLGIPNFITSITYDRGLPQTVRYANGVTLSYTYDRNGRLDTRTDTYGGTPLFSLDLNYDPNGNIIARTVNGKTNTYVYDDLNELIHADLYARQVEQVRAYDYGLGQVHEDYRGDKVVEVQPEDFIVDLDYAATSLSIVFNQVAQGI